MLGRDRLGHEPPEAGVDAVRVVADLCLEKGPRRGDPATSLLPEARRTPLDCDLPYVGDRQVVARELDSVRHAASLVGVAADDRDRLSRAGGVESRCGGQRDVGARPVPLNGGAGLPGVTVSRHHAPRCDESAPRS